tara:strand:+ start:8695 stop:8817 length:123 start_codon:yes stop_codon:yes gene_type:complete
LIGLKYFTIFPSAVVVSKKMALEKTILLSKEEKCEDFENG